MAYFENVYQDLDELRDEFGKELTDKREERFRLKVFDICQEIASQYDREDFVTPEPPKPVIVKSGNLREDCIAYLKSGSKIQAVKLWRENTGDGLKESLEAVSKIEESIA
jgi:ribosomal protein L7/L12